MDKAKERQRGAVFLLVPENNGLAQLIKEIAPSADDTARDRAMQELKSAIESFRQQYPYSDAKIDVTKKLPVDKGEYRTRGKVSEDREALATFAEALRACDEASKKLPLNAMSAVCHECGPIGGLRRVLNAWSSAASKAAQAARKKPDKSKDYGPGWLASQVARVLRDILQVRITMTTDRVANGKRGGAAYARLLRATLTAAGANAPENLLPIMKAGKEV